MSAERELSVETDDISLPATLSLPADDPCGVIVALHGAMYPSRDFFLYRHLAETLPDHGWAVLRFERRPSAEMVPLAVQVRDVHAVVRAMRRQPGLERMPVGLWGLSQGAWTAVLAAAGGPSISQLILVGFSAVTPSRQMAFATGNYLRSAGFGDREVEELQALRNVWEQFYRGELDRDRAQAHIDQYADLPWFDLAYVPSRLPSPEDIDDAGFFEFDPAESLAQVRCPMLVFYGDDDRDVPADESAAVIRRAVPSQATIHRYAGVGHYLTRGDVEETGGLDPRYERDLISWLESGA